MFKFLHILFIMMSIAFCIFTTQNTDAEDIQRCVFFILFGTLWAALEVQIEGENGWAVNLPTEKFFGTHFTWYHAIMNAMVFVLTFQVVSEIWALPFWISALFLIEDYMWFMINPDFGIAKYNSKNITWHKIWFWHMPLGNWISAIIMLSTSMINYYVENDSHLFVMTAVVGAYLFIATIISSYKSTSSTLSANYISTENKETVTNEISF